MKYNLNIQEIKIYYKKFLEILNNLLSEDIRIEITINQLTKNSNELIKQFKQFNFLNLENNKIIPLNDYFHIFQNDQELNNNLQKFVRHKTDSNENITWILEDQKLLTNLDCKRYVDEFCHYLFICKTNQYDYCEFIINHTKLKYLTLQTVSKLKGYKNNKNQQDQQYIIYGTKEDNLSLYPDFRPPIVCHEIKIETHFGFFIKFYFSILQKWAAKSYLVLIQQINDEIIFLIGAYPSVITVQEIITRESQTLHSECAPIKSDGISLEQFKQLQLNNYLLEKQYFKQDQNNQQQIQQLNEFQKDLEELHLLTFQGILYAEFNNKELKETVSMFNFEFNQNQITELMIYNAKKLAKQNENGSCIIYFFIAYGNITKVQLKKELNYYLKIENDQIYDPNQIKYLNSLDFSDIQQLQDDYLVTFTIYEEKILISGKQQQIEKLKIHLEQIVSFTSEVVEYYQFKSLFNLRAALIDYKELLDSLILNKECDVDSSIENTRIKIKGKQKNITDFKKELEKLEIQISEEMISRQIQVDITLQTNVKETIKQLTQKYKSITILEGECEGIHLNSIYKYKMKQSRIKLCTGSPLGLLDIKSELLSLHGAFFIFPIEKIGNSNEIFSQNWEQEFIDKKKIDLKSQSISKHYQLLKYSIEVPINQTNQTNNCQNKKKKQVEIINYTVCLLYYQNYDKIENFMYYFDKLTLQRSYGKLIEEFNNKLPTQIYISCINSSFVTLFDTIIQLQYPKTTIYMISNQLDILHEINNILHTKDFNEEEIKTKKVTQHFTVMGCINDIVAQVIDELRGL